MTFLWENGRAWNESTRGMMSTHTRSTKTRNREPSQFSGSGRIESGIPNLFGSWSVVCGVEEDARWGLTSPCHVNALKHSVFFLRRRDPCHPTTTLSHLSDSVTLFADFSMRSAEEERFLRVNQAA